MTATAATEVAAAMGPGRAAEVEADPLLGRARRASNPSSEPARRDKGCRKELQLAAAVHQALPARTCAPDHPLAYGRSAPSACAARTRTCTCHMPPRSPTPSQSQALTIAASSPPGVGKSCLKTQTDCRSKVTKPLHIRSASHSCMHSTGEPPAKLCARGGGVVSALAGPSRRESKKGWAHVSYLEPAVPGAHCKLSARVHDVHP